MKDKRVVYIILACIAIIAAIIIAVMGLNVGLRYSAGKQIDIYIGKEFDVNDMKTLVKEVIGNEEVIVRKVEVYGERAEITVKEITDEQVSHLNTKINDKYGLDNTVDNSMTVTEVSNVRMSDVVRPFILPIGISLAIILVYAGIRYRKIAIQEVLLTILGLNIFAQLLYLSVLAITRLPVTIMTIPTAITIYAIVTLIIFHDFETRQERLREQDKKKRRK